MNKTATNSFKEVNNNNNDVSRVNNMTQPRSREVERRKSLSREREGSKSEKEISLYNNNQGYSRVNPPLKI